ncbi:metallophosphoesterase family protein [Chloroflexota bacterium]
MRIAILADIHGNDIALKAVLDDVKALGEVDGYWILGDLVAIGHAPVKVLESLQDLPNKQIVRGNTDRYVCTGDRPGPTAEQVFAEPGLMNQILEVEGDFCWTQGAVTSAGWLDWLSDLPLEYRTILPDGTRVLCVHASPDKDGGSGIQSKMKQAEIELLLSGCRADLICVGHTHQPFSIQFRAKRIINPGSVSNHVGPDVRASYAILEADENGCEVEFFRVGYDHEKVIDRLEQIKHPARRFIKQHLRGGRIADL